MNNPITEVFANLTDAELIEAINEMREDDLKGIIRIDGWVRRITNKICEIPVEDIILTHLMTTIIGLYKEAAYRFSPKQ